MIKRLIAKLNLYTSKIKLSKISQDVRKDNLTYLSDEKLYNLENCLKNVEEKSVSGFFIEAGIALGGSAIIISTLMSDKRYFHGYDVFGMIPPPSEKDDEKTKARYQLIKTGKSRGIGGDIYYGYITDLYEKVVQNFTSFGLQVDNDRISLHQGLFEDTMNFQFTDKIAFAHIDCDWYEPVKFCLEKIYPILSPEGYIVLDDYHDYNGCKKAVHEFLAAQSDMKIVSSNGNIVLMRESQ